MAATEKYCPTGFMLELSIDGGTTWTDHTATVRHVNPSEQTRDVLRYNTSAGPVICSGPPSETDIEIDNLYQEIDTGAYAILRTAKEAGDPISLRWTPEGGTKQWTALDATITSFDEPDLDNDADSPLFFLATISAEVVTWDVVAP